MLNKKDSFSCKICLVWLAISQVFKFFKKLHFVQYTFSLSSSGYGLNAALGGVSMQYKWSARNKGEIG